MGSSLGLRGLRRLVGLPLYLRSPVRFGLGFIPVRKVGLASTGTYVLQVPSIPSVRLYTSRGNW